MSEESLDNILNGTEADEAPPEAAEEAPATQPRDEHGRFAPKGEKTEPEEAPSAPPAPQSEEAIPIAALKDERRRRQEAEQRLAELEARLNQAPPQPMPSVFDSEEDFASTLEQRAVQRAIETLTPQMQQQMRATLIEIKRQNYRDSKPDFAELETELFAEMQSNAALAQQVASAEDPVEFGYRYMKNKKEVARYGSLDLDQIRAKIREELQAEAATSLQSQLPRSAPPTLSGERNVGSRTGPEWSGPASLADILGR